MAGRGLTVGVLSPLLAGTYFGELLKGIAGYVATAGGRVVAVQTLDAELGDHYLGPSRFVAPVAWDMVDGFVAITRAVPDDYLRRLQQSGRPVVTISHHVDGLDCPEVRPDNRAGVADAVSHLVSHGHTRIGFVGDLGYADVRERYEGYLQSLARHSIEASPDLLFRVDNLLEEGGAAAAGEILARGAPCTAVVTGNDQNALGLVRALTAAGLHIPADMAVVGFDDVEFCAQTSPPLASVRQDFERVSATAARLLVQLLQGESVAAGEHRVPTSLVTRESCGCDRHTPVAPGPPPGTSTPARRFAVDLARALAVPATGPGAEATLERCTRIFVECFEGALASLEVDAGPLQSAAGELFHLYPRPETVVALQASLSQYRRDLLAMSYSAERMEVLDRCTEEVSRALNSAQVRMMADANDRLQTSLRNEYAVSMGLVGLRIGLEGLHSEAVQVRSLDWMAGTQARNACLGLWHDQAGPGSGMLRVAGRYGIGTAGTLAPGSQFPVREFPPLGALTAGSFQRGDLVYVLPVRTVEHDWGMLAVAGPPEAVAKTGRDIYFQWAALVGVALDHDALVDSLEQQQASLAGAYRREHELAAEVRESEERYALAASAVNDGLWDWDILRGAVFYSERWKALLGYDDDEIGSSPNEWLHRAHPEDASDLSQALERCLRGEVVSLDIEHRLAHKDGSMHWFTCRAATVPGPDGGVARIVGSLTDITDRKQLEQRLVHAALYDSLTGLPNRPLFMDRLGQAVARARRLPGHGFSLLFLDLDGFKAVNDTYGHMFGDLLLVEVAGRITAQLRDNDTPVRFGGDEFAVLLDGVTRPDHVAAVVRRLESALAAPYRIEGTEVVVPATVGVASSADGYEDPEKVLRRADEAMYRAKPQRAKPRPTGGPGGSGTLRPLPATS